MTNAQLYLLIANIFIGLYVKELNQQRLDDFYRHSSSIVCCYSLMTEPFYRFFAIDYCATGEGRSVLVDDLSQLSI
jgi:hypothetical protein